MSVFTAARLIFKKSGYFWFLALVAGMTFLAIVLLPHAALLQQVFTSSEFGLFEKLRFITRLLSFTGGSFTAISYLSTLLLVVIAALNLVWLVFYIRASRGGTRQWPAKWWQLGGMVAGVLGLGCAACGIAISVTVFQLLGITWVISYLPLHGAEVSVLAIVLLSYSLWRISKRIVDPQVCKID